MRLSENYPRMGPGKLNLQRRQIRVNRNDSHNRATPLLSLIAAGVPVGRPGADAADPSSLRGFRAAKALIEGDRRSYWLGTAV